MQTKPTSNTQWRPALSWPSKLSSAISLRRAKSNHNDDCVLAAEAAGIFAVADGLSRDGGAEASELICAVVAGELMSRDTSNAFGLVEAEQAFHHAVGVAVDGMRKLTEACPAISRMGTTLTIGWFVNGNLYYAHAGSSRLYLLRKNLLTRISKDHSIATEHRPSLSRSAKEQPRCVWKCHNEPLIGPNVDSAKLDVGALKVRYGDRFTFVTKGITQAIDDDAIQCAANMASNPKELCQWLALAAWHVQSDDDMSALVVDIQAN